MFDYFLYANQISFFDEKNQSISSICMSVMMTFAHIWRTKLKA